MTQPLAPAPPPGPGVVPPFPAPPGEGRGLRLGLGLGVGALILALVGGGGLAALIGLGFVMTQALNEQAEVVVGQYLDDVREKRYADAYESLCASARGTESSAAFTSRVAADPPISSYSVGDLNLASRSLSVPVDVEYADGTEAQLDAVLDQNRETGQFEVCRVE